jgi:hypothetical protein
LSNKAAYIKYYSAVLLLLYIVCYKEFFDNYNCNYYYSPHGARVSGVVEETPGRLEYEVALYKEAPPVTRHSNHSVDLPVDQVTAVRHRPFIFLPNYSNLSWIKNISYSFR